MKTIMLTVVLLSGCYDAGTDAPDATPIDFEAEGYVSPSPLEVALPVLPSGRCDDNQFELQILGRVECWSRCYVGQKWDGLDCTGVPLLFDWYAARDECKLIGVGEYLAVLTGCEYDEGAWDCDPCLPCGDEESWALEGDPLHYDKAYCMNPAGVLEPRTKTSELAVRCVEWL